MKSLAGKRVLLTGASGFIGTNLVDLLTEVGADVRNADIAPPLRPDQNPIWVKCDVMDASGLRAVVADFDPHLVVHLAARTDSLEPDVETYAQNYVGSRHLLDALPAAPSLERYILVSTQFTIGPQSSFTSETEFAPHTAYGQSKVLAEQELRANPPSMTWAIVRPTNIWGPWHLRYQREFWRVLGRGLYLHPTKPDPIRSYGYVGSVSLQILAVLLADPSRVHERALYVGDDPIPQSLWVDAFSRALRGKRARRVPGALVNALASVGEVAKRAHIPFPITRSRFRSMTLEYPTPMDRTRDALGGLPSVPLELGVEQSVAWLRDGLSADVTTWLPYLSTD